MDTQKMFDTVVFHLLIQNERSITPYDACAYRGEDGLKCAVGVLIKDSFYSDTLEGHIVTHPTVQEALRHSFGRQLTDTELDLLQELQSIHDTTSPVHWDRELVRVARAYKLNFPKTFIS